MVDVYAALDLVMYGFNQVMLVLLLTLYIMSTRAPGGFGQGA